VDRPRLSRPEPAAKTVPAGFLQPGAAGFRPGPAFPGAVNSVAVQTNGPLAAWGIGDHKLAVSDRTTGQVLWTVTLREGVKGLCFTPEGNLLAGGAFNRVREWKPTTGEQIGEYTIASGIVDALALQPAGSLVAVGNTARAKLLVYERPTFRLVKELVPLGSGLQAVAFSADGKQLAAGYQSGSVCVWEVSSWREVRCFQGLVETVHALAFHPSGRLLATGGADRNVRLWNLATGQLEAIYRGHAADVLSLVFGPRGDWLASGSKDQTVRIWDPTRNPQGRLLHHHFVKGTFAFDPAPAGLTVRTSNLENKTQAWLMTAGQPLLHSDLLPRDRPVEPIHHSAMLSGGRLAITTHPNARTVSIWEANAPRPQLVLPAGEGAVQAVAGDRTGSLLVWATAAKEGVIIRRWDATTRLEAEPIRLNVPAVRSLTLEAPDGWLVAVTSPGKPDGDMVVWTFDLTGEQPPQKVLRDTLPISGVAFHPDGHELAVAVGDTISLFRVGSWEPVQQCSCLSPATDLAYSPDGRRLAAVNEDGVVTLLDPAAGKALFQLHSLGPPRVRDVSHHARVAFSPDGVWLISNNWDGTFNLWDSSPLMDQ
jgi:WD40 repeat protein